MPPVCPSVPPACPDHADEISLPLLYATAEAVSLYCLESQMLMPWALPPPWLRSSLPLSLSVLIQHPRSQTSNLGAKDAGKAKLALFLSILNARQALLPTKINMIQSPLT